MSSLALAVLLLSATASAIASVPSALDTDGDGVPDGADACPGSSIAREGNADANGCTRLQLDADLDGWCNPDRPRDAQNGWLPTKDEWCVGEDNCKFVANPNQAISVPGATLGDACNTGELSCTPRRRGVWAVAPCGHAVEEPARHWLITMSWRRAWCDG
jgi:hypothetical protein